MTDNRTTELLREGLTKRGIEWRSGLKGVTFVGDWCFVEYDNGRLAATCEPVLTSDQAIAATLGSERNTSLDNVDAERDTQFAKAMRRIVDRNTEFGVTDIEESHRKADELMCDLLLAHGYAETVDAFKNMRKWYG